MKVSLNFYLCLISVLLFSCSSPNENENSPAINGFQSPIVTGLRITNTESCRVIAIWGSPSDSPDPSNSLPNAHLNKFNYFDPIDSNNDYSIPEKITMHGPCPNPNDGSTTIYFKLPIHTKVKLWICQAKFLDEQNPDLCFSNGAVCISSNVQTVRNLYNKDLAAGYHSIIWDGNDDDGNPVASGFFRVYFSAGDYFVYRDIFLYRAIGDIPLGLLQLIDPNNL